MKVAFSYRIPYKQIIPLGRVSIYCRVTIVPLQASFTKGFLGYGTLPLQVTVYPSEVGLSIYVMFLADFRLPSSVQSMNNNKILNLLRNKNIKSLVLRK